MNTNPKFTRGVNAASILIGTVAIAALAWMASRKISATHINIITADSLFLPLLYDERFFGSRLPSSSFLFPDFLYYAALHGLGAGVVDAVIVAGLVQCALTTALIVRYCGIVPALVYNFLYYYFGPTYHFLIGYHQGIVLLSLLYLRFQEINARRVTSLVFTVADPLFAVIAAVSLSTKALYERTFDFSQALCILVGYCAAFYLCESSPELFKLLPIVLAVLFAGWITTLQRTRELLIALERKALAATSVRLSQNQLCSLLLACSVVCAWVLGQPTRYLVPMTICAVVFFSWGIGGRMPNGRTFWASALIIGAVYFGALYALVKPPLQFAANTYLASYACLSDALRSRGINAVATDYWTSKPLYLMRGEHSDLTVLPLNLREGIPNSWAIDRRFLQGQTRYIVRNTARCSSLDPLDRDTPGSCSAAWYTANLEVKTSTEICGAFDLVETNRPVDFSPWADAFRSKPSAFAYNLRRYIGKLVERLQGRVNAR